MLTGAKRIVGVVGILAVTGIIGWGQEYTVVFSNESGRSRTVVLFQSPPDSVLDGAFAVAWHTAEVATNRNATIKWDLEYRISSSPGQISVGSVYTPTNTLSVDLTEGMAVTFDAGSGQFSVSGQGGDIEAGTLTVSVVGGTSGEPVAIGIGLDDKPLLVAPLPENATWQYRPSMTYRIAFGQFEQGGILDESMMDESTEVRFSDGVRTLLVTLADDGTYQVEER
jgi:hypothetical protein